MKAGKRVCDGLIAWRTYPRSLDHDEKMREITRVEQEGLEFVGERNSRTTLMFMANDGRSFTESRLRAIGVHWNRSVFTYAQLRALAVRRLEEEAAF
jgi:hypothetical protein